MNSSSSLKIYFNIVRFCHFITLWIVTVPQKDQWFNLYSEDLLFSELYKYIQKIERAFFSILMLPYIDR